MNKQYVICIKNKDYEASLELRKVYQAIQDNSAPHGLIRIIDESGEDYLYPSNFFVQITIPKAVEFVFTDTQ